MSEIEAQAITSADPVPGEDTLCDQIVDYSGTVSDVAKVAAGLSAAAASFAAPTGLSAIGVSLGLVSAPLVVTAAPFVAGAAGLAFAFHTGVKLYSEYWLTQPLALPDSE